MNARGVLLVLLTLHVNHALSQEPPSPIRWSFAASTFAYFVPDDRDYLQPTISADHGQIHFEARYNNEALRTASAWAGLTFSGGDKVRWEVTPMLGLAFGETTGVAPVYHGSLSCWKLELYSEGEYLLDLGDASLSFFYNWSELTVAPVEFFRIGLVTQRTRAYQTDRDIQRGLLAGFSYRNASLTAYVFNPDDAKPTVVMALGITF